MVRRLLVILSAAALVMLVSFGPAFANGSSEDHGKASEEHGKGKGKSSESSISGTEANNSSASDHSDESQCDGDPTGNSDSGHGANQGGPYDNTCPDGPSENGNGNGNATGRPCAGCVGQADDKNPKGQYPDGSDDNNGYECDGNHGIGRTNPAHTGCSSEPETPETPENPETPETPENPETPETPENPETPETPEIPTEVLGESFSKSPQPVQVLGVQYSAGALPRTGLSVETSLFLGMSLVAIGLLMESRRKKLAVSARVSR